MTRRSITPRSRRGEPDSFVTGHARSLVASFPGQLTYVLSLHCRYQLEALSGLDNILVVDNVPLVNADRRQKLLDRLRQAFAKAGAPLSGKQREDESYEDMEMPWDKEADSNKG